jgi:hypothetical protein
MCWLRATEERAGALAVKAAAPDTRAKVRASFMVIVLKGEVIKYCKE